MPFMRPSSGLLSGEVRDLLGNIALRHPTPPFSLFFFDYYFPTTIILPADMDELDRIKKIESDLKAGLEKAREDADRRIEEARASRKGILDSAARKAEEEVEAMISESASKAGEESKRILSEADDEILQVRSRMHANSAKAVEYVVGYLVGEDA
ncbi:MAG: hypothetical protein GF416_01680 [Candidatus Altiarchaeales archaeon]|nr:hypothetical protein [Candidatus Altiarchaeales archaeon]MBD3415826.1 hypothetical protein [Candidatus Altiarchaeales archaeon]